MLEFENKYVNTILLQHLAKHLLFNEHFAISYVNIYDYKYANPNSDICNGKIGRILISGIQSIHTYTTDIQLKDYQRSR